MMPGSPWRGGVLQLRRAGLLYALLVACLATMVALGYRAQVASRFRYIAMDRTLRGNAESAAWLFSAMAAERLNDALQAAFAPLEPYRGLDADSPVPLPAPDLLQPALGRSDPCPAAGTARPVHRLDLRTGELASAGAEATPREWLAAALRARASTAGVGGHPAWGVLTHPGGGAGRVLAYTVIRDALGSPVAVYAFPTCLLTGASSVYAQVASSLRILPPSLSDSLPNDSIFSISVTDASGVELYHSAVRYVGPYAARVGSDAGEDAVVTRLTLRPDVAMALVSGSLPPSQLSFLMLLVAVSGVLLASALVLMRREERFTRMREEFLAGISHELRTPLAQIRMFAELLQLGRPRNEREQQRCLAIIDQESRRLTHLVDNILQFTRGVRSAGPLPVVRADLSREITEAADAFRPLAAARGVKLELALAPRLEADLCPHALRQVLLNVLDNAVKFGPPGQTVWVAAMPHDESVRILVDDQGPGIPKRERGRVWRAFYRLEAGETSSAGSGLGLAVVRDLVRRLHGRVWVDGAPGGGARFVIELPRPRGGATGAEPAAVSEFHGAVEHAHP